MSPICTSQSAELNDENINQCEDYLGDFVDRWFQWIDEAEPVPEAERAEQQAYDFRVRELGYATDPMNVLPRRVFGEEEFSRMLDLRMGRAQMEAARIR